MQRIQIKIRRIKTFDITWIRSIFKERWGGDFIVTRGKIHRPEKIDGFIAEVNNKKVGLITFKTLKHKIEIISFDSFLQKRGVGTALLNRTITFAKKEKLKRIWLITTNDNLSALGFWQKRGFNLVKIYPNAMEKARKLKPNIPLIGQDGIPLRDEIKLAIKL